MLQCWMKMLRDLKRQINVCLLNHDSILSGLSSGVKKHPFQWQMSLSVQVALGRARGMLCTWLCYLPWCGGRNCGSSLWPGHIWERWSPSKCRASCNCCHICLNLPCPSVVCKLVIGSSLEGQDWKVFWASISINAMVSIAEQLYWLVWSLSCLQEWSNKWVPWWKKSEASVHVTAPQYSCKGLSITTWLPESHPGICYALIQGFTWHGFTVFSAFTGNSPWVKVLNSKWLLWTMQCFPLPFSHTFVIPQPLELGWLWQRRLSSWLWHKAAISCTSASVNTCALQMVHVVSQMSCGQDKGETSALRHCYWSGTSLCKVECKQNMIPAPGVL